MVDIKDLEKIDFLDTQTAMFNMGECEDIYIAVLREYVKMHDTYIEDLSTSLEKNDFEVYAIKAHALKGNSATIGATRMSEHAKEHEFAGKEGRYDFIYKDYDNLISEYNDVVKKISDVIGEEKKIEDTKSGVKLSAQKTRESIFKIINMLDEFEVDEAQEIISDLLTYSLEACYEEALREAYAQMEDFEYGEASDILKESMLNVED